MPELGRYATEIYLAWGATFVFVLGLIAVTTVQSRRARAALEAAEARREAARG